MGLYEEKCLLLGSKSCLEKSSAHYWKVLRGLYTLARRISSNNWNKPLKASAMDHDL